MSGKKQLLSKKTIEDAQEGRLRTMATAKRKREEKRKEKKKTHTHTCPTRHKNEKPNVHEHT